ncbi:MAG TPA: PVC-type heme-binding CxxCH protein [Gemmataceae bacterium]|jgi:putative membrane-bound dehydrogenase-like protein
MMGARKTLAWLGSMLGLTLFVILNIDAAEPRPGETSKGPLSPREEQATFRLPKGFEIDLVAAEPDVIDPVAMAFDEAGRIYVAEMRGYPNGGVATGHITSGRIKLLEDRDGDGVYETSHVYAEGLRFPTGVLPWQGGLLVANAPDILYFEDTNGDGKADRQRVLYTGFNLANIQQIVNSLQWGLDNWVYGVAGSDGGTIRSPEKPDMPPLTLRARGIRFHPETPGSLEATSGGGQYGLAPDEWQHWFTATNSQHLRHIVLPDHYLRRNPALAVSAVTLDIPDHGAACQVHRISPFEAWRVERTSRRKEGRGGFDPRRFAATELVPGGYITSACSPIVYSADAFPEAYRGNVFVCDPANNLIHRDVLVDNGATFIAKRAGDEQECEFLASTDNWFRPVHLTLGPDGALYVLDFYREVIETPLSLPEDMKQKLNLESRGRGRLWRIRLSDQSSRRPSLRQATTQALVEHVNDGNLWWRLTAQRLLIERQDKSAVRWTRDYATTSKSAPGRAHALWTLRGLKALTEEDIEQAMKDPEPGVREQALRLAEERLPHSAKLRNDVTALADDPSPRVRFQLAFTLGASDSPETVTALARVARQDAGDRWTQTAVLSSVHGSGVALLEVLVRDHDFLERAPVARLQLLSRLAAIVGAKADDGDLARALRQLASKAQESSPWQVAVLDGLGQGLQNSARPLTQLWGNPPRSLKEAVEGIRPLFEKVASTSRDAKRSPAERIAALRLLGRGPDSLVVSVAEDLLNPQTPPDVQSALVRSLSLHPRPEVADLLLANWNSYSPTVRREVVEALFARADRLPRLLDAIEHKKVLSNQLEPLRLEQLRRHANSDIRRRARSLLGQQATPERQKIVAAYRASLELNADTTRGKVVFMKNCTICHRLENEGFEVGPDLLSALRNKSPEQLLNDILDPSRELDPRYLNYQITTKKGQVFSGLIAADTASSVTLRRGEKAEDTILRDQIEEIQATGKSLMPEGLETQLSKQDIADLIAYLQAAAVPRKSEPNK